MNRSPNLWLVGASVRALANSCVQAGYAIQAADQFNDLDLQQLGPTQRMQSYPQDLLQFAYKIDAGAWLYTGGLENEPELIDAIAARLPLLGNSGAVLRHVRDVRQLHACLFHHGFEMPEMRDDLGFEDLDRWLIKSSRSSGGLRVREADSHPLQSHEYYQQYIPGEVYGAVFLASMESTSLLGVSRHLGREIQPHVPRFQYAGSIGPIRFAEKLTHELQRMGLVLANTFQLRGWFGVDFVLDDHARMWILEVNPRYTASVEVLERAAGVSSAALHVQASTNKLIDQSILAAFQAKQQVVGKVIHYADRMMRVTPEQSQLWLAQAMSMHDLADIPAPGMVINPGEPIFTQFVAGENEDLVMKQLAQLYWNF